MKRWPYLSVISVLAAVCLWLAVHKPKPEVVVQEKVIPIALGLELAERIMDSLDECDAALDVALTTHNELAYNLDLCTEDYNKCMEEKAKASLKPEIAAPAVVPAQQLVPSEPKALPKHQLTMFGGIGPDGNNASVNGTLLNISDRLRPVVGAGYTYFVTDSVGLGVMGATNRTFGITLTYRF